MIAVEDDMPLEEVAQTFAESGYSRLPVYHDTIDNIIGAVSYTHLDVYKRQGLKRPKRTSSLGS